MNETRLPAWASRLLDELDTIDSRARQVAGGLSEQELNWQPGPAQWSVGQCLEHLRVMNEVYLPAMRAALTGRKVQPAQEIQLGWFARWFVRKFVQASPASSKVPAPKKIAPPSKVDARILEQFLASNQEVRLLVKLAAQYDVNRVRFQNPLMPVMFFTVGTGLEIVVKHEERHLLQAGRVRG